VEALQKRHEDFENSLAAQDERLKMFSEAADKLITAKHYDSKKYVFLVYKGAVPNLY
jgi:spectrin beta